MNTTWNTGRLGDVCRVVPGYAFKSSDWQTTGIPVVKIKNITGNNDVELASTDCVAESLLTAKLQKFVIKDRDILIAMTGATAGKVGRVRTKLPLLLNQRVAKLAPVEADPDFIWAVVSSQEYQERFFYLADGAAQPNMSGSQIEGVEIPLPPLPVQQRIAGILSAYDELIENSARRVKILESMARALYREWFVHFRFPGHESVTRVPSPLGEIPQGWEVKSVKEVSKVTYGFPFASKQFNADGLGTPVIRIRDILEGSINTFTEEEPDPKYHIKNGDILIGMDGDFHMCIWSSGHAFQNQRVAKFESNGEIGNYHLFLALELPIKTWNKSIVGTTVAHLGDMHIKAIHIAWPPTKILTKARETLEPMSQQIIALKCQIQNLRRTRDLLLPRLLSGQIDVANLPEREAA